MNTKTVTFEKVSEPQAINNAKAKNIAEDRELVKTIQEGTEAEKQQAFTTLYNKYHDRLEIKIRQSINEKDTANDIIQEVFTKVFKNIDRYNPSIGSVSNWIYNITRTTIIDIYRSRKNFKPIPFTELSVEDDNNDNVFEFEVPVYEIPLTNLLLQESMDKVKKALEQTKCTKTEQKIFMDVFYNRVPYEEIAEKVNLPLGSLKSLSFRLKEKVKKFLKMNYPELQYAI